MRKDACPQPGLNPLGHPADVRLRPICNLTPRIGLNSREDSTFHHTKHALSARASPFLPRALPAALRSGASTLRCRPAKGNVPAGGYCKAETFALPLQQLQHSTSTDAECEDPSQVGFWCSPSRPNAASSPRSICESQRASDIFDSSLPMYCIFLLKSKATALQAMPERPEQRRFRTPLNTCSKYRCFGGPRIYLVILGIAQSIDS